MILTIWAYWSTLGQNLSQSSPFFQFPFCYCLSLFRFQCACCFVFWIISTLDLCPPSVSCSCKPPHVNLVGRRVVLSLPLYSRQIPPWTASRAGFRTAFSLPRAPVYLSQFGPQASRAIAIDFFACTLYLKRKKVRFLWRDKNGVS